LSLEEVRHTDVKIA